MGINLSNLVKLKTATFNDLDDMLSNISSPLAGSSTTYPLMCFGVAIEEPVNGTINVNLVFSGFN